MTYLVVWAICTVVLVVAMLKLGLIRDAFDEHASPAERQWRRAFEAINWSDRRLEAVVTVADEGGVRTVSEYPVLADCSLGAAGIDAEVLLPPGVTTADLEGIWPRIASYMPAMGPVECRYLGGRRTSVRARTRDPFEAQKRRVRAIEAQGPVGDFTDLASDDEV